jgi:hypothetical protein
VSGSLGGELWWPPLAFSNRTNSGSGCSIYGLVQMLCCCAGGVMLCTCSLLRCLCVRA